MYTSILSIIYIYICVCVYMGEVDFKDETICHKTITHSNPGL